MSLDLKVWQTTLWMGDNTADHVALYGKSPSDLRDIVARWLREHEPATFANAPQDHSVPRRITRYFYSDGTLQVVTDVRGTMETLPEGWYYRQLATMYDRPPFLGDEESMIAHLLQNALIIEPGPDYKENLDEAGLPILNKIIPLLAWGTLGALFAICFLSAPIRGGMEENFIIAQGSLILIIAFIIAVSITAMALGPLLIAFYKRIKNS